MLGLRRRPGRSEPAGDRTGGCALPYDAEISRANPGCILFMIDRSGSMEDPFFGAVEGAQAGQKVTKAQGVADAINRLLSTIVIRCTKEEGARDYFDVGVLGYG